MDQDQVIRLVLQQLGFEGLPKSKADADALKAALLAMVPAVASLEAAEKALGSETYEVAVTTNLLGRSVAEATRQEYAMAQADEDLIVKVAEVRVGLSAVDLAMEEVAASSGRAASGVSKMSDVKSQASVNASLFQQRIQGLGYAMNDFTSVSGDMSMRLNSIANNMPMLLAGFGGLGLALSAILPVVGLVIKNWDSISSLWDDRRPITNATESVHTLSEALKKNEKALDDLREKGTLNLDQLVEFNKLNKEAAEIVANLAAARETEANKKNLGKDSNTDAQGRATGVKKAVAEAGGYDDVVSALVDFEQRFRGSKGDADEKAALTKTFEDLLNKALKGDEAATKQITTTTASGIGKKNFLADMVEQFNPNTQKKQQYVEKQWDEMVNEEMARMSAMAEAGKEKEKAQKLTNTLNEEGLKGASEAIKQTKAIDAADSMEAMIVDAFGSIDKFNSYKADQAADKKSQHTADQAAQHQKNAMAQNITRETGGDVRGDAAQAAAERAIQYIQRGANVQQAMQQSVFDLMHGFINDQAAMLALYERNAANVGHLANMHAQNSARLRSNLSKTGN